MAVVFVDGISHYTTAAQGSTKLARLNTAPVAGTGAFGSPGYRSLGNDYNQINFPASGTVEFAFYFNCLAQFGQWVVFYDNNYPQVWLDTQPDGSISVYNGALDFLSRPVRGTLLGTVPASSMRFGVQSNAKIRILHSGAVGTFEIWIDSVSVLSLTGKNTAPSGNNQATNIRFLGGGATSEANCIYSHLLIASASGDLVGTPRVGGLFPNGVGATSAWTPSAGANYTCVDETTPNDDTDYVSSSTVGNVDTYTMQDTPAGTGAISGLAVTIRIKKDDANSRLVAAVLRIGGVDYVHPTPQGVPGGYSYLQFIWTLNPATGTAFTKAVVDALEAGYKVTS